MLFMYTHTTYVGRANSLHITPSTDYQSSYIQSKGEGGEKRGAHQATRGGGIHIIEHEVILDTNELEEREVGHEGRGREADIQF